MAIKTVFRKSKSAIGGVEVKDLGQKVFEGEIFHVIPRISSQRLRAFSI